MGAFQSNLDFSDIEELQAISNFSQSEIKQLYKRFERLDKERSGRISGDELLSIPELAMNPLAKRVVSIFDSNGDDHISFKHFVQVLSVFNVKCPIENKIRFAFKIYDINNDGFIDKDELYQVLKMMVGDHLNEGQLKTIILKTFQEVDKDQDDKISYDEFAEAMSHQDFASKMSIQF